MKKRKKIKNGVSKGSFSIRRDNSCQNAGNFFLLCKLHMLLNLMEPRVKQNKN